MNTTGRYTQLHLGLGSFHRAHQAVYLQALMDQGQDDWQIVGGNIRPDMADTIAAIGAQGGYTLETVTPQGQRHYQYIESIRGVVPFDPELRGLAVVAADPLTRIISFTVTEAGYYLDADKRLDSRYADIASDLAGTTRCTIYGALAFLLEQRRQANAGPVTLLNCDNLRSNGKRFFRGFLDFLLLQNNTQLLEWVEANTSAPDSMVDRITPRPGPDVAERVLAATGRQDGAALMGESFIQWVIEDHFVAGRPQWQDVGAELVADVSPYEEAKIRLLNATHSCIAWGGALRGYRFIHEGTLDQDIRALAFAYASDDAIPCLLPSPLDLDAYRDVVLDRFSNPAVEDTIARVAMDGYSKIPGFILPTLRQCLGAGRSCDAVAVLPALFLRFLQHREQGLVTFEYQDQGMPAANLAAILQAADPVAVFCADALLFEDLAGHPELEAAVGRALERINRLFFPH